MRKYIGILAACICLLLPGTAFAQECALREPEGEFHIPEMSEEIEALLGGVPDNVTEQKEGELYRLLKKNAELASCAQQLSDRVYDPRKEGKVTPVRLQSSNTCWAFSSLAAGEQSLIYKGQASPASLDLSEAHLAYFFYHPVVDPLGNTAGDGNANISGSDFLSVGSNTIFSTFALANWVGAADESVAPFDGLTQDTVYADSLAYADTAHLQNAYWINFKDVDAVNIIKQMIRKYGAAAINLYWGYRYYNSSHCAYYFPLDSSQPNNHSVTIVGWDDTYPKENFNEAYRPQQDGAWIVKNSYGEGFGEGGYFYLSYEDSAVNSGNTSANRARAYVFDFEPADNYDRNYQYDGSAGAYNVTNRTSAWTKVDSQGSIANVFTVHNGAGVYTEELKAVSFALFDTAVSYRIQIYKNPVDPKDPTSGVALLTQPVVGSTSYAGYYTAPLDTPVLLNAGDVFSVVITLEKESGEPVEFFVDKTYQNGNWASFTNAVEEGQSFRFVDGQWEDMAAYGATVRLKAFTDVKDTAAAERITLPGLQRDSDGVYMLDLWMGENYTIQSAVYPSSAGQTLQWTSSDPAVATVDAGGVLTPVGVGSALITGSALDGSGLSATIRVHVKQKAAQILLSDSFLELEIGESVALNAELSPAGSWGGPVLWKSSGNAVSVDDAGVVEAIKAGEGKITAYLESDPGIYAVCSIQVVEEAKRQIGETGSAATGSRDAVEVNGISRAVATGGAKTSDNSVEEALGWCLAFGIGVWLMKKGMRGLRHKSQ